MNVDSVHQGTGDLRSVALNLRNRAAAFIIGITYNLRDNHAGQFPEKFPDLAGGFVPTPSPAYLFSKPLNWLDFDPSYPKSPKSLEDYIRKWRMEKGLLIKELAKEMGVTEDTVINWEMRGRRPQAKHLIGKLSEIVPEVEMFFVGIRKAT